MRTGRRSGGETFLVLAQESSDRIAAREALSDIARVEEAATTARATGALTQVLFAAFVLVSSRNADALDWLSQVRRTQPSRPALVFVDEIDCIIARRAVVLDAQCAQKPVESHLIRVFAQRALSFPRETAADLDERIGELVRRFRLSEREAGLLAALLHGMSEKEYACSHGISINTCKTYARRALAKIGALSLGDVRDGVLRSLNVQAVTLRR